VGILEQTCRSNGFGCEQTLVLRTISSLGELESKRVLVRCDLNVPIKDGVITDDGRIKASLPTIKYLIEQGARVIICSHLGRPDGSKIEKHSLKPVAIRLAELLGQEVTFAEDCVGELAESAVSTLAASQVLLLENLRFHASETSDLDSEREEFAKKLSNLADLYVSDGFGVLHRKQASVFEIASLLPSGAGYLVENELSVLKQLMNSDSHPYTVVLGGSKVSDKLGVISALLPRVDNLLIGGGMVFTFLAALGHKVGKSLLEQTQVETVKSYLEQAKKLGVNIVLPNDIVMARAFAADADHNVATITDLENTEFGEEGIGLDIGPESSARFSAVVASSKLCFWNGPMGVFEFEAFSAGTKAVASALTKVQGLGVVGGGDSAAAVRALGFQDSEFGHISTGGGASLEYLEGKSLPGLEVLA
jgi:phosphoglycerate kinase